MTVRQQATLIYLLAFGVLMAAIGSVLEGYIDGRKTLKRRSALDTVTQREKEVLKLLGEGHQNKEIADLLNISVKTVEKHRANLMTKLDLHNAAALTRSPSSTA